MLEDKVVIKRFDSFVLGFCKCGCGEEIPIRTGDYLRRYSNGHNRRGIFGKEHSQWKGGKRKTKYGYMLIMKPDHPKADRDGYVFEHRDVYETENNCCLLDSTDIDHINGIKDDNRIENLRPFTRSKHISHHKKGNSYRLAG